MPSRSLIPCSVFMTVFSALAGSGAFSHEVNAAPPSMVEFFSAGKMRQGLKLLDVANEMVILGKDGWMHTFDPRESDFQVREINAIYSPISTPVLRNQLLKEFGNQFEVKVTRHFLIVQSKGRGDEWAKLFEDAHQSFLTYMRLRGVVIREGRFPMVAVVMPDEQAMQREFKRLGIEVSRVAGIYAGESNRVMTHDGGRQRFVAETLRHEAAHQSAFNSGVHSRLTNTPKWISEGIGQMFEPPGMANTRRRVPLAERVNRDSLGRIKKRYTGHDDSNFTRTVMDLFSGDTMFDDPQTVRDAYAVSWAMMFYLAEREPKNFARLLNETSHRPPFREYSRVDRMIDFERILGCSALEFSHKVSWYIHSLKD